MNECYVCGQSLTWSRESPRMLRRFKALPVTSAPVLDPPLELTVTTVTCCSQQCADRAEHKFQSEDLTDAIVKCVIGDEDARALPRFKNQILKLIEEHRRLWESRT